MITLSATQLENYLKEYALHLKYWAPDDGDGTELLGARELLETHYSALTDQQKTRLQTLDQQAHQILSEHKKINTFDVKMLEKSVELARHRQAA